MVAVMKHLDLFSGIGGFALAARNVGWETVGFCEIEPYCQKVLKKHWPKVKLFEDIKEFNGYAFKNVYASPEIITGGFPCQPFSTAARGRNNAEDLWPEMLRIIRETGPRWVVAENVGGNKLKHIERACAGLSRSNYQCWPFDISIETRRHQRRRFWIVAHANSNGKPDGPVNAKAPVLQAIAGLCREPYSESLGMDDGLSAGMDRRKRLKALGNAIVPQVAEVIFRAIQEIEL